MNYKHNILTLNIFNCLRIPNPGSRVDFYTKELMLRGRFVIKNLPPCGREPEAGKTGRKILLSLTAPNTHIFS